MIFGFFGLLMIIGTLQSCLTRQVLQLNPGQLEAKGGLLGLSGPHVFSGEALSTLSASSSSSQGNTHYYTLRIQSDVGKKRTLVTLIKGKNNADRLIAYIQEQCGAG